MSYACGIHGWRATVPCPMCSTDAAALRSENDRLHADLEQVASDYQDLGQKWNAAEAALSEAMEVLSVIVALPGIQRELSLLDRGIGTETPSAIWLRARAVASPPPETSGDVYRDDGQGWALGTEE